MKSIQIRNRRSLANNSKTVALSPVMILIVIVRWNTMYRMMQKNHHSRKIVQFHEAFSKRSENSLNMDRPVIRSDSNNDRFLFRKE